MDFFQAQDNAKKKTKYYILVYALVLMVLTALSTLVLLFLVPVVIGKPLPSLSPQSLFSPDHLPTLIGVGTFVVGGALISSYMKSRHLSKGGEVIAASLGGVLISPNTRDLHERKVLNVVEEMAIASGMPVPEVYLLKSESGINAFAAGQTPMDAVIGVTQGCIDKLSRTQLQGVIGHEFSHILNGDMRLNLRIIMLLHGIEFIGLLGRILTQTQKRSRYRSSNSRSRGGNGALVLAGIALRIIGWFGILFGNMIQAAVSRQREFLADASSVQFTRDPSAIVDALKVIGGVSESSRLRNTDVGEVAHMFFGQSFRTRFTSLFATHPPIDLRIRTIEPGWDGRYLQALTPPNREQQELSEVEQGLAAGLPEPLAILMAAGVILDQLNESQQKQLVELTEKANDAMEAMALVVAVLIDGTPETENVDWSVAFANVEIKGLQAMVSKQLALLKAVGLQNPLPLIELAMPALKQMSESQYQQYKALLEAVMLLDDHKTVFEQSVFQLITRYLDVHFGLAKATQVKYRRARQVAMEIQLVFSVLVHYGHQTESVHRSVMERAFKRAVTYIGLPELHLLEITEDQQQMFNRATEKLIYCALPLKQKIAEALTICIEHDGQINEVEKELVLAIAATMDAPLPRIG